MKQQVEPTFKEKVIDFLNNRWKAIVIGIGVVVVVMIAILVADYTSRNKDGASAELSEDIQEAYAAWIADDPDARDDTELLALIDKANSDFSRHFAHQRGQYTLGLMALENKEWTEAYTLFESVAEKWPKSYLASVSLFNAGSAREESGDSSGAIADWRKIVDEYALSSADAPEALFNIGRVEELRNNTEAALEAYQELESTYPSSRWTDIAKSRILDL